MNQPIAIQSWCFRHFKALPDFFAKLKECGVNATEVCGVHANFTDKSTFKSTVDQYNSAGIKIVAIGVQYLSGDKEKDRPNFEFCKQAGIGNMSISFGPESMFEGVKNISALADEYDLKLGIHNHGGYDWLGNERILKFVFDRTSPRIGLHMDTAWALDAGQDPCGWIEKFGERVVGVHVKDFIFNRAGKEEDVVIGEGNLDLPKMMKLLNDRNFSGPLVIEYEGDVENPVPALRKCVEKLAALM
jgi:sugar phosphate isomerase/epimerase